MIIVRQKERIHLFTKDRQTYNNTMCSLKTRILGEYLLRIQSRYSVTQK